MIDDRVEDLTEAVERILGATESRPSKIKATYVWEQGADHENLVPLIEIEWYA